MQWFFALHLRFYSLDLDLNFCFRARKVTGTSLRSRRLEVVGERENGRARGRHAKGEEALSLPSRVSFSRARFFLCPISR